VFVYIHTLASKYDKNKLNFKKITIPQFIILVYIFKFKKKVKITILVKIIILLFSYIKYVINCFIYINMNYIN
jgi:hypothetical protein